MTDDEKKIIIDEDWKAQAQKEKEILKERERMEHEQAEGRQPHNLPDADFPALVSMLATQGFYSLGAIRNPEDKDKDIEPDWAMAKFNIDLLSLLEEKCKGNLSEQEEQLLKSTLEQLRMLFVQLSEKD